MNVGVVLGSVSAAVSTVLAVGVFYKGWRGRVATAATKPFTTGQAAVDEALLAVRLKDQRLAETTAELEQQRAANAAQAAQISDLYTQLGHKSAEIAQLEEQARAAKVREDADRARIGQLEMQLDGVMKQLGLGH